MKSQWMSVLAAVALVGLAGPAAANNIGVANIALQGQDTNAKTVRVVFDLAWDNSWRGTENWDAAWVFVKFRAPLSNNWEHAKLSTVNLNHTATNGTIEVGSDGTNGMGVFVYRSSGYTGSVNYAQTKLQWNYGSNGYDFAKGDRVEVSVHAIEMVYVPQGSFYLGSGGTEVSRFYRYTDGSQSTNPFLVSAEANAITVSNTMGNLYYTVTDANKQGDRGSPIPAAFPKGYNAFYCMKYEITQGQYADFLNKLTGTQWTNRQTTAYNGSGRHTISGTVTNCAAAAPTRACNYICWDDLIAYEDWAALRPMTELEFEKACRGSAYPVVNEYAWGNASLSALTLEAGVPGSGTETVSTPVGANCNLASLAQVPGPTRVGIFATNGSSRAAAGATYWGIMEMSGNVNERPVTVGHGTGRAFTGVHGDGKLTAAGAADVANWPLSEAGAGYRGGLYDNPTLGVLLSDRSFANDQNHNHNVYAGGRGVRLAP